MASTVTSREHTGDGSDKTWAYTFQSYQQEDIKVAITNAAGLFKNVTNFTIPDYSTASGTVTFNNTGVDSDVCESDGSPKTGRIIRIFRETDITTGSVGEYDPKATYTAGSAVKAGDLNNNAKQALYAAFEVRDQEIQRADIRNDSIDGTKIDDDSIDSEHYVAGSIDLEHMSANSVDSDQYVDGSIDLAHMSANSVDSDQYVDGSIDRVHLAADIVDGTKIADDSINSEHYVDGSIDTAHIADLQVTGAKIANDTITNAKIVNQTISNSKLVPNSITASELASGSVSTSYLANYPLTNDKILNLTISNFKLVQNSFTASELADNAVGTDEIADNAVTVAKIADGELSTLASMQSGTASKLADSTALTADIADLNQIDGLAKQTTITDDDAKFPTSGAVVDYVAAQILPIGGLEVIANDASFPNTQALSGVVISIADAGGLEVNGSGSSTTARTVGGSTVTINNINSAYNSSTVENGVGFLVSSTGSGQIYNYHKSIIRDQDIISISSDINDFGNRYRVGSSNPSSSNDAGDLFFNTTSSKLLVYNGSTSAWEEAQSVGNFYINTISSYSGTGGNSASFNGSAYRFVLSNAGTHAQQHIVSINGVIQKPNSGTSQPSEGFVIDGSSIIFSNAPATGSDYFIVTVGAAVNIGSPGDNAVATISLQNASVTTAKIAADAVDGTKIADNAIDSEHYTDGSIDLAHMSANSVDSDQYVDGSIDTAHIAADQITGALIADDAVGAEHIEVLDANLQLADNAKIQIGTGNDLEIFHNGTNSIIHDTTSSNLNVKTSRFTVLNEADNEHMLKCQEDGAVELYYNGVKKFESTSAGVEIHGTLQMDDNQIARFGNDGDLQIYHTGAESRISDRGGAGALFIESNDQVAIRQNDASHYMAKFNVSGSTELYHNNVKKFETQSTGAKVTGDLRFADNGTAIFGDGDDSQIKFTGTNTTFTSAGKIQLYPDGDLEILDNSSGEVRAKFRDNAGVELYHNNIVNFETNGTGITVYGPEGGDAYIYLHADEGEDDADKWRFQAYSSSSKLILQNKASGGWESNFEAIGNGAVKLDYDNSTKFETTSLGSKVTGGLEIEAGTTNHTGDASLYVHKTTSSDWGIIIECNNTQYGLKVNAVNTADYAIAVRDTTNSNHPFRVEGSGVMHSKDHLPIGNNSYDLGTSSYRWRNIYTNDLHLSNEGSANSVDGTWGNYTIQEGEDDLFLINKRNGKK